VHRDSGQSRPKAAWKNRCHCHVRTRARSPPTAHTSRIA
jgi:hypothetical protein